MLKDAFVFTCDRMRRYEGAWHLERLLLFPGTVFLESQDGELLRSELECHPEICQAFGMKNGSALCAVDPETEGFLKDLYGASHHFRMSRGYIRDGKTFVTEGPLRGKESLIRKIDRHKRVARVRMSEKEPTYKNAVPDRESAKGGGTGMRVESLYEFRELQVGLEVVAKS